MYSAFNVARHKEPIKIGKKKVPPENQVYMESTIGRGLERARKQETSTNMGQSTSKSRTLPKSHQLTRSVNPLKSTKTPQHPKPTHHKHTESHNENASKMGVIRTEEVPLKLDQNHPSLRSLRNKKLLEKMTQEQKPSQRKKFIHPNEFIAIVEDLNEGRYSHEQITKNYRLESGILEEIAKSGLSLPTQRVELKNDTGELQDEKDLNRMNGVPKGETKFESALEDLMKG